MEWGTAISMAFELQDSTLREGEQQSGRSFSVDQKVAAAEKLDELGLDIIQVGFPVADDGTKEVIERLNVDAKLTGMARAIKGDIDAAVDAGVDVAGFGLPTSDVQREKVLGLSREELKELAVEMYEYAEDTGLGVSVGAMDGFRTDPAFINELIELLDPPRFGLADTVGVRTPLEVTNFLDQLECDLSRISVHFHRDLGVGTANTLAAAQLGVGKADVTVGGIGDRVGNVALEEVVVAGTVGQPSIEFDLDVENLIPRCLEILDILDVEVPELKAVIGHTAFEHESGMHTAAMLDDPTTFEPFDPARFGGERRLLFGDTTGRGAARQLLERAGLENPSDAAVAGFLDRLHDLDEHVGIDEALTLAKAEVTS